MKIKEKTLADLARPRGGGSKRRDKCRICLTPESFEQPNPRLLRNGICEDRRACEAVQPPLISRDEL